MIVTGSVKQDITGNNKQAQWLNILYMYEHMDITNKCPTCFRATRSNFGTVRSTVHARAHTPRQLAVNDLDEIDLAAGQITVCVVHPHLHNIYYLVPMIIFMHTTTKQTVLDSEPSGRWLG